MNEIYPLKRYTETFPSQSGERSVRERLAPIYSHLAEDGDDWQFQYYMDKDFNDFSIVNKLPTTHKECNRFRIKWAPRRNEDREEVLRVELERLYKQNLYMRESLEFCKAMLGLLSGPQGVIDAMAYKVHKTLENRYEQ